MGGNKAIGAGLKPLADPAAEGVAISSRGYTLMSLAALCYLRVREEKEAREVAQQFRQILLPQNGKAQPWRMTLVRRTLTPTSNSTQSFGSDHATDAVHLACGVRKGLRTS